jgi:hypothetical protein
VDDGNGGLPGDVYYDGNGAGPIEGDPSTLEPIPASSARMDQRGRLPERKSYRYQVVTRPGSAEPIYIGSNDVAGHAMAPAGHRLATGQPDRPVTVKTEAPSRASTPSAPTAPAQPQSPPQHKASVRRALFDAPPQQSPYLEFLDRTYRE